MTVVNAIRQGRAAYLITDMAVTDQATGKLLCVDSKFIVGHNFPWGLAPMGNACPHAILQEISRLAPRDARAMVNCLPTVMNALAARAAAANFKAFKCGLFLAMWSKQDNAPTIAIIDSDGSIFGQFIPPRTVATINYHVSGGGAEGISSEEIAMRWPDLTDPAQFDVDRDGTALVAMQRARLQWSPAAGAALAHRAGGGVQVLRAGKRGVSFKTIHTWPEDAVSELIRP